MNNLNKEDREAFQTISERVKFPLKDIDNFKPEAVLNYALELKSIKEEIMQKAPLNVVIEYIEDFLNMHNTCTLSTSFKNRVRSTPIEYNYKDGFIYLLSEGGEKFSNINLNKNVSIAVYEDYTGMDNLAGMQINGKATIVDDKEEYAHIINMKGLNLDVIKNMPFKMNIIKIELQKAEFLYSKFKKMGYEIKQIYNF